MNKILLKNALSNCAWVPMLWYLKSIKRNNDFFFVLDFTFYCNVILYLGFHSAANPTLNISGIYTTVRECLMGFHNYTLPNTFSFHYVLHPSFLSVIICTQHESRGYTYTIYGIPSLHFKSCSDRSLINVEKMSLWVIKLNIWELFINIICWYKWEWVN